MFIIRKTIILLSVLCVLFAPVSAKAFSAESFVVMDADSGRVLYENDADRPMLIASTTKIMTALVALEHGSLTDVVTVTRDAAGVEGSSMYLKEGDKIGLEQLLYGMLLVSGNDAAEAVACHIAGDADSFAELMNDKARELGMTNSSFANPHGLDDENHYSTARDMAILMRAALDNEELSAILATKTVTINGVTYKNHNKLLWMCDGVIGGKTGYTSAAGRTLVSCCERDGVRLICVTLNDPDDWDDHMNLYDRAFDEYRPFTAVDSGTDRWELPVIGGDIDSVSVVPAEDAKVMLMNGEQAELEIELPQFVYGGFEKGDSAGSVTVRVNGQAVRTVELVFAHGSERQEPKGSGVSELFKEIIEKYLHSFELGTTD